jgi:CHAD domain-containing protein
MEFSSFCTAQASRLLDRLAFAICGAARSHSPEAVHDLRVAVRRFTQAVALGKPCLASHDVRKMRRRLKPMMRLAGEVRDCDVALKLLARSRSKDSGAVEARLRSRRAGAGQALVAALHQWTSRNSLPKWHRALVEGAAPAAPGLTAEGVARRKLPRVAQAFFREGDRAATRVASANQLHDLRLAAKKLRYTMEMFTELYGPAASGCVEQLRTVQNLLGSISDCSVTRRLVEKLGAERGMLAAPRRRERRKIREFREAWEQGLAEIATQWAHTFQHPRKPMTRAAFQGRMSTDARA